ncbi:photosystem II 22 kDa protein, chloroplastic [Dorcoceras hygrometricum]|uniref:Photosystem II 22 kDa protein, chloroplastic n=1 Tax=Dorcoceras hygrometricum TaxID=472368 RepID=A0A2Z7BLQ9_9LAMI|nr:photosystem II 22 kDa protein, chloroplastic [Dorcoceras hygrometricum]
MAAQTTMLISTGNRVSGHEPLVRGLKPNPFPRFLFPSIPTVDRPASSSSATTRYVIESMAKAPPAVKKAPAVKKKSTVEDGIFGTSGGIGFTKQNELFVGRVAMIGFAASLLGEAITGKGILAQLNLETGIPIYEAEPLLLFFILFNLLGAIGALGDRGRFVDDATGLDKTVVAPGKGLRAALGLGQGGRLFGFTKANELFVGRLAQLGIAFSIIGEIITGKGALAQLNIETGVPINEIEPLLLFNIVFFFVAAINPGSGKFVTDDEE